MSDQKILERLDFIEFRQQLLFTDKPFDRLIFEYNVTRPQLDSIYSLFDSLRDKIESGEGLGKVNYEAEIYRLVPQCKDNFHFAEELARTLHEDYSYEEVFEALYDHAIKFKSYLENRKS